MPTLIPDGHQSISEKMTEKLHYIKSGRGRLISKQEKKKEKEDKINEFA